MDPAHERNTALSSLQAAAAQLEGTMNIRLIPPDGVSFGFALRGARDKGGVAAVNIGINRGNGKKAASGTCAFNTEEPVVPLILTAMKFDPVIRSAAVLQFSDRALAVFEDDLFLECSSVDKASEQPGISTMDWGIASCCRDGVPGLVWKKDARKETSRLILLGEGPSDVVNNIIICSNRI
jgi:predicted fused transcriptional regulator/phosphomethylpyrimidine kinase